MADQRTDQLTEDTSPLATDMVYVEHDPAGTPADRKVKVGNLVANVTISESQVTNLTTDLAAKLAKASNLSDLADAPTARTNLGLGTLATKSTVASADITDGTIVNGDINAAAAIAYSKLALTGSVVNGDLAGAIGYSKLTLTGSIVNGDVSASAGIAYSKLNLATSIVNADISTSAAIATTKIAGTAATLAGSEALTNKTLDNTNTVTLKDTLFTLQDDGDTSKQAKFELSGLTTATTRTYTLPDRSDTIVTLGGSQALVSKTLVSGGSALSSGITAKIEAQAGGVIPFHATGAFLGLDYVATEFSGQTAGLDLRGGINVANLGLLGLGSGASTTSGQIIGAWHIGGAFNDQLADCATIQATAAENFSGDTHTAAGSRWQFLVTADTTNTQYAALTIDHDGQLIAGSNDALGGVSASRTYAASGYRPVAFFGTKSSQTFTSTYATPVSPALARDQATYIIGAVSPGAPFHQGFNVSAVIKNDPAINTDFEPNGATALGYGFRDQATVTVDTATNKQMGIYRSFAAQTTVNRANSGSFGSGALVGYYSAPTVGAGNTLDILSHYQVVDVANSGTITQQVGINIGALSGASQNIGILSAASIYHTGTGGIGYSIGAGGTVTQTNSRSTAVTLNKISGAITLVLATGGTGTVNTFTVNNSTVVATDTIILSQKSGTDHYNLSVSAVGAGSFAITYGTTNSGNTNEQPVFNFSVIKGIAS